MSCPLKPDERQLMRECREFLATLTNPKGHPCFSAIHLFAQAVSLEARIRAALPEPPK